MTIIKDGNELHRMSKGDSFGEQALYEEGIRGCTVQSTGESICLALGRDELQRILGNQL